MAFLDVFLVKFPIPCFSALSQACYPNTCEMFLPLLALSLRFPCTWPDVIGALPSQPALPCCAWWEGYCWTVFSW